MTDQELREKLSDLMADLMVDVSLKKLQKYDGGPIEKGRQYIASHNDRLKLMMVWVTQYGDTRERDGRKDELLKLANITVAFGKYARGRYEESYKQRLAELKEEV